MKKGDADETYLETEEGSILKSTYSANAWKGTETDGEIYAVPYLARERKGGFIAVQDSYLSYFTDYDGTYMTLRNIYDRIGNEELKMVISSTGSTQVLMLSGYAVLCGTLYEEKNCTCASSPEFMKRLYKTCSLIHQDLLSGVLINKSLETECISIMRAGQGLVRIIPRCRMISRERTLRRILTPALKR